MIVGTKALKVKNYGNQLLSLLRKMRDLSPEFENFCTDQQGREKDATRLRLRLLSFVTCHLKLGD